MRSNNMYIYIYMHEKYACNKNEDKINVLIFVCMVKSQIQIKIVVYNA